MCLGLEDASELGFSLFSGYLFWILPHLIWPCKLTWDGHVWTKDLLWIFNLIGNITFSFYCWAIWLGHVTMLVPKSVTKRMDWLVWDYPHGGLQWTWSHKYDYSLLLLFLFLSQFKFIYLFFGHFTFIRFWKLTCRNWGTWSLFFLGGVKGTWSQSHQQKWRV